MNILFFLTPKSEVDYIEDDASVLKTLQKMRERNYSEIPIVKRTGEYVGTIKSGDILGYIYENQGLNIETSSEIALKSVRRIRDNKAVNINCQIEDMVEKVLSQNFVPVVDDEDKFIGIITRSAVMKYMHDFYTANNKETGDR